MHQLAASVVMPQSSVWKVLRYTLKKKAYHVQVLHKLEPDDYATRKAMCYDLCQVAEQDGLMDNIFFSDEATFHTCGAVNRHNCRIWASKHPNATIEWKR
ncbi:unnamed protein product, partial [Larinioides sclopetarius]